MLLDKISATFAPSYWDMIVQVFKTGKIYLILGLDLLIEFGKVLVKPGKVIANLIDIIDKTKAIYELF